MGKHTFTPTPWHVDTKSAVQLSNNDWRRAQACVNAFPDDFPTEKITPGLVGRMRGALAGLVDSANLEKAWEFDEYESAAALLAELDE